ncbi:MAG: glycosyltransferase [Bdellovibrionaceae bacterium]|nr:glycosyltransferase [Pseudobdellovibrionaceae bacterium]
MSETTRGNIKKVMVVGASPDRLNTNSVLRGYVADGFSKILGSDHVLSVPMESVSQAVLKFQPDVVLVFGSCMPDSSYYISLRTHCDEMRVPLCFWLHDDPYEFDFFRKIVPYADHIFSNDRFASLHYPNKYQATLWQRRNKPDEERQAEEKQETGIPEKKKFVSHLPLAASETTHFFPILDESEMENDIFFCGVAFENRRQMIRDLHPILKKYRTYIVGPGWEDMGFQYCFGGNLSNREFARIANRSRFVLNMGRHGDLANSLYQLTPSTPGPRTFEAAMAGGLQLFFAEGLEILDYFSAPDEIFLFDSRNDVEEIFASQALSERCVCRANAQKRALRDHTYVNRARVVLGSLGF